LLAREVVITAGDGEESLEAFHELVKQLCEYYEPVGVIEESLVQTIATCWWRKARVLRAENGEIRKRLDTQAGDWVLRDSDKGNLDVWLSQENTPLFNNGNWADQQVSTRDRLSAMQEAQRSSREWLASNSKQSNKPTSRTLSQFWFSSAFSALNLITLFSARIVR